MWRRAIAKATAARTRTSKAMIQSQPLPGSWRLLFLLYYKCISEIKDYLGFSVFFSSVSFQTEEVRLHSLSFSFTVSLPLFYLLFRPPFASLHDGVWQARARACPDLGFYQLFFFKRLFLRHQLSRQQSPVGQMAHGPDAGL